MKKLAKRLIKLGEDNPELREDLGIVLDHINGDRSKKAGKFPTPGEAIEDYLFDLAVQVGKFLQNDGANGIQKDVKGNGFRISFEYQDENTGRLMVQCTFRRDGVFLAQIGGVDNTWTNQRSFPVTTSKSKEVENAFKDLVSEIWDYV